MFQITTLITVDARKLIVSHYKHLHFAYKSAIRMRRKLQKQEWYQVPRGKISDDSFILENDIQTSFYCTNKDIFSLPLSIISYPFSHFTYCSIVPHFLTWTRNIVGFILKIHRVPDIMQLNVDVPVARGKG